MVTPPWKQGQILPIREVEGDDVNHPLADVERVKVVDEDPGPTATDEGKYDVRPVDSGNNLYGNTVRISHLRNGRCNIESIDPAGPVADQQWNGDGQVIF